MSDEASSRLSAPSAADFAALSKQIYATQGENALQTAEPNYRELVTLIYAFLFVRQGAWQQYFLGPAGQAAFESEGDRVDFSLSALQQSLWTREHQSPDQVVCDTIFDTGDAMFYCRCASSWQSGRQADQTHSNSGTVGGTNTASFAVTALIRTDIPSTMYASLSTKARLSPVSALMLRPGGSP